MSFNFEFTAMKEHAVAIVNEEHAPIEVKEFIQKGLVAFKEGTLVHVKAMGHLYNNDYQKSTAVIEVGQVTQRLPKVTV